MALPGGDRENSLRQQNEARGVSTQASVNP